MKNSSMAIKNLANRRLGVFPRTLRIPEQFNNGQTLISGTSGSGKTNLIMTMLEQIAQRGESAVINDPEGEYLERFYDADRGDWILNPCDARCAYWHPGDEVQSYAEALTIANSFFPTDDRESHKFFYPAAAKILAVLLAAKPRPEELASWMGDRREIERRIAASGRQMLMGEDAPEQSSGVTGTLQNGADSLRLLIPSTDKEARRTWNARGWASNPKGWIFLTSSPHLHQAIMPLHSLWFDLLVMRIRSRVEGPPVWFVLDELASLRFLPQLHAAITMGRRSAIRLILGMQHKDQLRRHYGDDIDAILSMPDLRVYLRAGDYSAAEWASQNIGEAEVERIATSWSSHENAETHRSETLIRRLVLPSEFQALPPCHGYLQYRGKTVQLQFPLRGFPVKEHRFIARKSTEVFFSGNATDTQPVENPKRFYI
jgi:hypothetical protein